MCLANKKCQGFMAFSHGLNQIPVRFSKNLVNKQTNECPYYLSSYNRFKFLM